MRLLETDYGHDLKGNPATEFYNDVENLSNAQYAKLKKSIRDWYMKAYPDDTAVVDDSQSVEGIRFETIDPNATFADVVDALYDMRDVYPYCANDSVVMERVFEYISEVMGVDSDVIYDQWDA